MARGAPEPLEGRHRSCSWQKMNEERLLLRLALDEEAVGWGLPRARAPVQVAPQEQLLVELGHALELEQVPVPVPLPVLAREVPVPLRLALRVVQVHQPEELQRPHHLPLPQPLAQHRQRERQFQRGRVGRTAGAEAMLVSN
jgi:hypothetical protein